MKKVFISFLLILLISACSTNNDKEESSSADENEQAAAVPEVQVEFEQETLPVDSETTIQAKVTQEGDPVEDAEYVKFEIWHDDDGQDASKTIEAEHTEDGIYTIDHTFSKDGTYQVIAHTQVGDLHTMPQKEVSVGKETKTDGHDHSDTSGKFMVHLMTEQTFRAGEAATLTTHINHMEEPFAEAQVRFEISSEQMEKHLFIDAEEQERGEYTAAHTFNAPGTYTINVHYEKPEEEIHGHQEETIEVTE